MDKNRRGWIIFVAVAALLALAGGLTQLYLKDNLVVAVQESHHHAHVEDVSQEDQYAEAAKGENLIVNYSFEVGGDLDLYGWTAEGEDPGTSVRRDRDVSAYGFCSAALLAGEESRGTDLLLSQKLVEVPAGRDVTIKASVKTEGLRGGAFLRVSADAESEQYTYLLVWLELDEVTGTSDWRTVEGSVCLPPEVTSAVAAVGIYGEGRAWFDGISLTAADHVPAPLPRDANLLRNPGFSEGPLAWHYFSVPGTPKVDWAVNDTGGVTGPYLSMNQPSPVDKEHYSGFYQVVNGLDRAAGLATLGGWLKTDGLEGEAWLNLTFYGLDGKAMGETQQAFSGTRGWEYLELPVRMPANAESVWVRLIFNGTGTAAFDDLDFRLTTLP